MSGRQDNGHPFVYWLHDFVGGCREDGEGDGCSSCFGECVVSAARVDAGDRERLAGELVNVRNRQRIDPRQDNCIGVGLCCRRAVLAVERGSESYRDCFALRIDDRACHLFRDYYDSDAIGG